MERASDVRLPFSKSKREDARVSAQPRVQEPSREGPRSCAANGGRILGHAKLARRSRRCCFASAAPSGHKLGSRMKIEPDASHQHGANGLSEDEILARIRARRPRVLVVDDEDLFREALVFELSEEYASRVDSAADADEALEKAGSGFDLVLMDITMPGMDGFQALREMRARALAGQVVLMTANKTAEREAKAQELGVLLLGKPIEPKDLERVLLACLGGEPS